MISRRSNDSDLVIMIFQVSNSDLVIMIFQMSKSDLVTKITSLLDYGVVPLFIFVLVFIVQRRFNYNIYRC